LPNRAFIKVIQFQQAGTSTIYQHMKALTNRNEDKDGVGKTRAAVAMVGIPLTGQLIGTVNEVLGGFRRGLGSRWAMTWHVDGGW